QQRLVRGAEGLEVQSEDLELGRERAIACRGVDPGAERLELGPQAGVERLLLALGDAAKSEGAHEPIRLEAHPPGDLREPAGADPAIEVDLPQAILAVAEPLTEPQVV